MATSRRTLTRTVGLLGVLGIAVAGTSPTMAITLNPQALARDVGQAIPLVFVLATIVVALIAWCFARLARRHPNAGSAYGFVGAALNARWGLTAGWALLGSYITFGGVFLSASAIFLGSLCSSLGIWSNPNLDAIAVGAAIIIFVLSVASIRHVTLTLLVVEIVAAISIIVLSIVVLGRADYGASGVGMTDLFVPTGGIGIGQLALAMGFGVLSFAGFEETATLGEDSLQPEREIPIALIGTVLGCGVIYVLAAAAEVAGIYDAKQGMSLFQSSTGLLQTLGTRYVSSGIGDAFEAFALLSAIAGGLAVVAATSRMALAFARDLAPRLTMARISTEGEIPPVSIGIITAVALGQYVFMRVVCGGSASDVFFWAGTMGANLILIAYLLVCVAAGRTMLELRGLRLLELLIPGVAIAIIAYTLKASVYPLGDGAYAVIPFIVLGWMLLAIIAPIVNPALLTRVRSSLVSS